MTDALLEVHDLTVAFGELAAVDDLSFALGRGETLGIVGESGCGKSLTALALMRLTPTGARVSGQLRFDDNDLMRLSGRELERLRGARIAMIFQEPMTALNPVLKVGEQVAEMFLLHTGASAGDAWNKAIAALDHVHIPDAARRAVDYPHQLSGGMRQRVMIAMALACKPDLLIADEPTTALDVTVQAQILDLMLELQRELGMSMLFISHNLGVISRIADRLMVMYAGTAVELGPTDTILANPKHPYTHGLIATLPRIGGRHGRLPAIAGSVPPLYARPPGCRFADRCSQADADCRAAEPKLELHGDSHHVACFKVA